MAERRRKAQEPAQEPAHVTPAEPEVPEEHKGPRGESFFSSRTMGAGTILDGGGYGPPVPDPMIQKLKDLEAETSGDQ